MEQMMLAPIFSRDKSELDSFVVTCMISVKGKAETPKSYNKTHIYLASGLRRGPPSPPRGPPLHLHLPLCGPVAVSLENSRRSKMWRRKSMLLLRHRRRQHLVVLRFLEVLFRTSDPRNASCSAPPSLSSFKNLSPLKPLLKGRSEIRY